MSLLRSATDLQPCVTKWKRALDKENDDPRTPMGKLAIMGLAWEHPLKYQTRKENTPAASRMADT
ncbi:hypothetical protein GB937_002836 [Aspergillus fischeri]|nr:hypothetical protein GB937_002836 [Aspergillus fischeri]